ILWARQRRPALPVAIPARQCPRLAPAASATPARMLSWTRQRSLSPLACLLAGAISLPLHASAADVATDDTLALFASTQGSVRLEDGRTIHLTCAGEGSPAVILTAGAGDWGISWHTVLPEL